MKILIFKNFKYRIISLLNILKIARIYGSKVKPFFKKSSIKLKTQQSFNEIRKKRK